MDHNLLMDKVCDEYELRSEFIKEFQAAVAAEDKLKIVNMLVEKYGCGFDEARMVCDCFVEHQPLPPSQETSYNSSINVPKCPTCGSTNITKIGTFNRMMSTGLFGLASRKIGKTMKCNNCGYTW